MLAARSCRRAGQVDRGPAREPAWPPGRSRHEHADGRMAFDDDGSILAAYIDSCPTAARTRRRGRSDCRPPSGCCSPGPTACPRHVHDAVRVHQHRGPHAYRGPWQFESVAREVLLDIAARQMGIDPVELRRRNLLRSDEMPYTNPNGMPYDHISPLETFEQALEMLDYEAFRGASRPRRAAEGRYLGVGHVHLHRADHARLRRLRHRGRDDPHRALGQGERLRGRRIERQQPRDDGRAARRRRARRRHRGRRHHPGRHRASRRSARGTGGSRSGAMIAGAVARDRGRSPRAHRRHRRAPPRSRRRRHRARRGPGLRARHARRRASRYAEIAALAYFAPDALPPGVPAGLEASGRYTAPTAAASGPTRPTSAPARSTSRPGEVTLLRYIVERGLRADDQPERGRGPDRRRDSAGDRGRAVRAHRLRRRRQPARHDVHGLPAADRDRGPR